MFLDKKKLVVNISAILCFISFCMTLISFVTLILFIQVLPFSIIRINGAILWLGKVDVTAFLAATFMLIGVFITIMAGIDLLRFKKHIIFPVLALCLYLFDLWMIVVPNYFQGLYAFVPNAITDVIMIVALVMGMIYKRKLIKSMIKKEILIEKDTDTYSQ